MHKAWPPNIMLSFRKTNEPIPRKLLNRWKDGRMDRQTLFYKTVSATAGGPIKFDAKKNNNFCPECLDCLNQ